MNSRLSCHIINISAEFIELIMLIKRNGGLRFLPDKISSLHWESLIVLLGHLLV